MTDLDVAMRLRLLYEGLAGKRAKKDIEEIADSAQRLGRAGAGKLAPDLQRAGQAAAQTRKEVGQLPRVANDAAAGVRGIGKAAGEAKPKVDALGKSDGPKQLAKDARAAEAEIRKLNREQAASARRVSSGRRASELDKIGGSAEKLTGSMDGLGGAATRAFGALGAFIGVREILSGMNAMSEKARAIDLGLTSVAITAEMRDPKVITDLKKRNDALGVRYGVPAAEVTKGRQTFAAAGFEIARQDAVLDPTMRAAKAGDTAPETMSQAVVALIQNLKVQEKDVPAALDMMSKGAKLGMFEIDAMARNFPSLGAAYKALGREGLPAVAELVTFAESVMRGAGNKEAAATYLENLLQKATAPDTIKNFKDKGVDLEEVSRRAEKENRSYLIAMLDEAIRVTNGDKFALGELFGDMQAKSALRPLMEDRKRFDDDLRSVLGESAGSVEQDWKFKADRPAEKEARRSAAMERQGAFIGEPWSRFQETWGEFFTRRMDSDYRAQEEARERPKEIDELTRRRDALQKMIEEPASGGAQYRAGRERVLQELGARIETLKRATPNADFVPAARTPYLDNKRVEVEPKLAPSAGDVGAQIERQMSADLSSAATDAMGNYTGALQAEGQKAVGAASSIVDQLKSILNFTATPTINPRFGGPAMLAPGAAPTGLGGGGASPAAGAAPGKQSALDRAGGAKLAGLGGVRDIHHHYHGANPAQMARAAQREQNRAIRGSQGRALHDMGSATA